MDHWRRSGFSRRDVEKEAQVMAAVVSYTTACLPVSRPRTRATSGGGVKLSSERRRCRLCTQAATTASRYPVQVTVVCLWSPTRCAPCSTSARYCSQTHPSFVSFCLPGRTRTEQRRGMAGQVDSWWSVGGGVRPVASGAPT